MNEAITRFLEEQTCATICCLDENGSPYCFSCYYVFNKENDVLYFKSSAEAHHSALVKNNPGIAGTVLPDKLNKLITRGIQLQGEVLQHLHPVAKDAYLRYHKKFPMALAIKGEVFTIQLSEIKLTDSKFGFGKKINWKWQEHVK
jgi:uncharacterized protein YhbP (UPF0306 family)